MNWPPTTSSPIVEWAATAVPSCVPGVYGPACLVGTTDSSHPVSPAVLFETDMMMAGDELQLGSGDAEMVDEAAVDHVNRFLEMGPGSGPGVVVGGALDCVETFAVVGDRLEESISVARRAGVVG